MRPILLCTDLNHRSCRFIGVASVVRVFATKAHSQRVENPTVWECVSTVGFVWHPKKPCGNLRGDLAPSL